MCRRRETPQLLHDLRIRQVLLRNDLVEIMHPVHVPLQRISSALGAAMARHQRGEVLLADDVLVHAIQQALDDAKLYQSAHIDVPQYVEPGVHVHAEPLANGAPHAKGGHELDELVIGDALARGHDADVVGAFVDDASGVATAGAAAAAAPSR